MHPSDLFDLIKRRNKLSSDSALAAFMGLTPARINQMRTSASNLTPRQIAGYIERAKAVGANDALSEPIRPLVEMYPIEATLSKQEKKWELLPTGKAHQLNRQLRDVLSKAQGLYMLYDSQLDVIYAGKTLKAGIWKEMTLAFNRTRAGPFRIDHPTTGTFSPAWETKRQPKKRPIHIYDTAHFFSAYEVKQGLISNMEALVIRAFCNSLSNVKMEKFS